MKYSLNRPRLWWSILAFTTIQSAVAGGDDDALDVIREGAAASIRAKVTRRETAETSISPILCSNFIEAGFGYQVEGMWSEMLYNRSFEKWVPLRPNSANWYDLKDVPHGDWTSAPWYHTAYEHNRWYAWPGSDAPFHIGLDSTMIIDRSAEWRVRIDQVPGGDHGTHCLHVVNFEDDRWVGVAQDGKFFRPGQTCQFRGRLRRLSDQPLEAELRFYATSAAAAPGNPLGVVPLGEIGPHEKLYEASFSNDKYEGWTTLVLAISPGSVEIDAFSLMPASSVHGWRPEIFDALKRLNPGVIRYPGGCFASFHNWQDAIGPRDRRKPEPSYFWGDTNMNDVGTMEFLQLCDVIGAEAMLVVNLFHPMKRFFSSDGRPHGYDLPGITDPEAGIRTAADWVAYCNAPVTHPMGRLRAEHGRAEPFGVKYWEMDNEGYRWFSPEDYARMVSRYARAMKTVDPRIKIGVTSYGRYSEPLREILEICGGEVDFLADRVCTPENIAFKMEVVRQWNATHDRKIFYADTEALQERPTSLDRYTGEVYRKNGFGRKEAQRSWAYALTLASNLMAFQRHGGDAQFMCFNNLANTMSQSCIETPKECPALLTAPGYVFEVLSRTEAAWPLALDGYTPAQQNTLQVQAAWNRDRQKLVVYLLNRGPDDAAIALDLTPLQRTFHKLSTRRLRAEDATTWETAKDQGNIHRRDSGSEVSLQDSVTFASPRFSFTEIVLE
jgi:alpha-L-arabinofuranosidase